MKNANSSGQTIQVAAPTGGCTAGAPFLIRDLLVVPVNTAAQGELVTCYTGLCGGEYTFAAEAGAGQDWEQGEKLYWDDSESRYTVTAADNTFAGFAAAAKATAAATGRVLLAQVAA
jgi:predicted RecA/RadA family phage recombinase